VKKNYRGFCAAAACLAMAGYVPPAAQAAKFSLLTGFEYSSGNYGGSATTEITYIPVVAKYETGPWIFKMTVPYLKITGPGNIVRDVGSISETTTNNRTTESGMGDVVTAVSYNVYAGKEDGRVIDLTGKVKFGTADQSKSLGTGQNDYSAQVDVYQNFRRFSLLGTLGYKVLGSPPGFQLNNVFYGSLGSGYRFTGQTSAGLLLYMRQKASPNGSAQEDVTAYLSHKFDKAYAGQAYVLRGLTNGSPDWGIGATISRSF
jgi:hypothetical protein